jgi:Ankyrin repeats (many copies)/Ankyrin repeat
VEADHPIQTFSLTISGVSQHLISYYQIEDVEQGRLRTASSYPELVSLDISPEYLEKTHFRNPPKVEIGVDGIPRYCGEADDVEPSPHVLNSALAIGMPLHSKLMEMSPAITVVFGAANKGKHNKRYEPYATQKGNRTPKSSTASSSTTGSSSPYPVVSTGSMPAPSSIYTPGAMYSSPGPSPPGEDGGTPLHQASEHSHLELARFLIENDADAAAQDGLSSTPLHLTSEEGHLEAVQLLLNLGSRALFIPIESDSIRSLIDHCVDVDERNENQQTPLFLASRNGRLEVEKFLLKAGAELTSLNCLERTPLHGAS